MKKRYIFLVTSILLILFIFFISGLLPDLTFKDTGAINSDGKVIVAAEEEKEEIAEEEQISSMKLLAVGDIMFHMPQNKSAYIPEEGIYDYGESFKHIGKYAREADIAIANFETVTADGIKYSGFPRFNTPRESIASIKEAGFDILSTANNHSLDQGKKGIIDTIANIEQNNIKNIGTYSSKGDNKVLIEEINDIRLGFLSYTYGLNGLDSLLPKEELSYMVNLIDEDKIKLDIKEARLEGVDLVVVSIHWGNEYHREASDYQMSLGERMIDWGADIILGSHPHVIQKSQVVGRDGKDKFIIYSLGNFFSNQRQENMGNPYTEDGLMIEIEIEKNLSSEDTSISKIKYIPTWVYRYYKGGKPYYEILPIEEILQENFKSGKYNSIEKRLKKSYEDTMENMDSKLILNI